MKRTFIPALFFLLILVFAIHSEICAQQLCGSDIVHQQLMKADTGYRNKFLHMQETLQTILQNGETESPGSRTVYNIPVVVHVIHLGEPEGTGTNIPASQIQEAIDGLNDRFSNIIGAGLDMEIKFCLASRDPAGCPTNGITRTDGSAISNYMSSGISIESDTCGDEHLLKDLNKWPVSSYYNIWVVNKICGGWYGFAYFPWGGAYDGAVMRCDAMTYSATTLTHEIGHGLNLFHTFEGDKGDGRCPVDTNCAQNGDKICDTPPHRQIDCESTLPCSPSGIWDNSRYNHMSYCFPSTANARFTPGQKARMRASMLVYPRANLLNSLGCTAGNNTCGTTDIPEINNYSFTVYPNPAGDVINISGTGISNGNYHILLKNVMGQTLLDQESKVGNNALEKSMLLSGFSNGFYFLIIESGRIRAIIKIHKFT